MGIRVALRQHVQAVFRFAMSITRRKEVAEDLTSEAFLALHREMASIDPSQLPAWLLTVVRNRARNLWRHQVVEERYAIEMKPAARTESAPGVIARGMDSRGRRTEARSPVVRDAALRVRHDEGRDRRRDGSERDASASQAWDGWCSAVIIVKPETVITWHRRGFRLFWRWKSRGRNGRPGVPPDVRALIRELSTANPLWGARRIHGELQKLGVSVSQSTVAKCMRRHPRPPSQTW